MTQTLVPQNPTSESLLHCYFNQNPHIVIAKISNEFGDSYKKVIFPQERFLFEVSKQSILTIKHLDTDSKLIGKTFTYSSL